MNYALHRQQSKKIMFDKDHPFIKQIESMSINDARDALAKGKFGNHDSPNYNFAFSLIAAKESKLRDEREEESLSISRKILAWLQE